LEGRYRQNSREMEYKQPGLDCPSVFITQFDSD